MTQTTPALQDASFRSLRDYIYEQTGIFVPDSKKYFLENRLSRRVQENKLASFDDYLPFIRSNGNCELKILFGAVTTNETYFFREPQQFDVFTKHVLPRVLDRKRNKEIRVWSAACSSGEEAYTVAAILKETAPTVRADIIGSDISEGVLESARRGVYSSYSVRIVPPYYQQKYFRNSGDTYEFDEALRRTVRFMNVNLIDEKSVRAIREADVIFCRNVLIYFDDKSKRKAVSLLYDALAPNGFLMVGTSESLHNVTRALQPTVIDRVVLYQKAGS
ncbi:MAG: chemotaxis protein methyltransferase 2 [Deltaproteobacteria bacterium]|nr:chemotaxis protein methyltransferase 2 [Deltaproteobacteria bacterium]